MKTQHNVRNMERKKTNLTIEINGGFASVCFTAVKLYDNLPAIFNITKKVRV